MSVGIVFCLIMGHDWRTRKGNRGKFQQCIMCDKIRRLP